MPVSILKVLRVFPLSQVSGASNVLQYKLEVHCNTNWGCIAVCLLEVVVVGVSDILLINVNLIS